MGVIEILAVTAIMAAASFINVVVGFGFGLVSVPLMTFLFGPKPAILFVTGASFAVRVAMLWKTRKDKQWDVVITAVAGVFCGIVPGSYLLKIIDNASLKIFLGAVLLVAAALIYWKIELPIKNLRTGRFLAGVGCGFFSACTTIGGPPLALWFVNEDLDRKSLRGNLIWIFSVSTGLTLVGSAFTGTISVLSNPLNLLYTIPGLVLGYYFGDKVFNKVDKLVFSRIVVSVIVFGGVVSFLNGIFSL